MCFLCFHILKTKKHFFKKFTKQGVKFWNYILLVLFKTISFLIDSTHFGDFALLYVFFFSSSSCFVIQNNKINFLEIN